MFMLEDRLTSRIGDSAQVPRRGATSLLLLALLVPVLLVHAAEQWECRFLLSDRGVQFPEVREFVEDLQGRIWASSWGNGVACIQETSWKTYTEKNGLSSDWVRGLALGADGTVWISTPGGVCYVQGDVLRAIDIAALPLLEGDEPDLVAVSNGGDLLLSTFRGALFRIRGASDKAALFWEEPEKWEAILTRDTPDAERVADFEQYGQGPMYISFKDDSWAALTDAGLNRLPGPGGTIYLTSSVNEDHSSTLWTAASMEDDQARLYALEGETMVVHHTLPEVVRGLARGPDGWCYAGSTAGLYRFNETEAIRVDLGHQVGFPDINEVFFASDGSLWLGTREGLVRGARHAWKHFPATADHHALIALLHDPLQPGQLLGVDERACLTRLQDDAWSESVRLAAPEALTSFFTFGAEPVVWGMGSGTLYRFSCQDGSLIAGYPTPPISQDCKLFKTSTGELWLGADDGAYGLVNGVWEERPRKPGYKRRRVSSFCEPTPGVIYVGVTDGIERWAGDEVTYFGEPQGVSHDDAAYAICPTRDGHLWFGTYGDGVYHFDGKTFERFDDSRGLAHHSISNILEATDGTLWFSYRRVGLASYREARWLNFSYENGLTNSPIQQLLEDDGGKLWLVTRKEGFYQYRPDSQAPETFITGATRSVARGGMGVFSFQAVDAWQRTPAQSLLFSWRVLDERAGAEVQPWNNFSPQTSSITAALSPGTYRFEVRASDDARNVDATPATVSFSVAEPLWREPRVYAPAGIMLLLLAAAVVLRVRAHHALRRSEAALFQSNQQLMNEIRERLQAEQRLNDHFEQLEELVRGRTAELEAAQRALVEQERLATLGKVTASVSHELRNPLGTLRSTLFMIGRKIQHLDLGLEEALARGERSIQRCDRIIEEFLDFTRTVAMEREVVAMDRWLKDVLQEMQLPSELHCDFQLDSGVELEVDPERLRRAVVNVVNNAVQAMTERDGGFNRLRVKSRVRGERYEIVINDNGPGMSQESLARIFEPLYSTKGFGVGLGVPIVKGIMDKHQGGVEYHSAPGQGTTVVLWIPRRGSDAGGVLDGEHETAGEYGHAD